MMFNIIIGWELFYNGEYDMQNVLVCDDDEAILESLRIYLDNAGFNVITAGGGGLTVRMHLKRCKITKFTALCLIL